ncbi:MAG TPA: hypothetical protein VLE99_05795 [Candidatus Saccharimonadales bacterium]|nr:hypothetical protein [Candidatus Saccharimonadales bacterium]
MKTQTILTARNLVRSWLTVWAVWFLWPLVPPFSHMRLPVQASQALFWIGALLTVPVFVLFYRGKAEKSRFNPAWIMYVCIVAWCLYLLLIGGGSVLPLPGWLLWAFPWAFEIAGLLTLPALVVAFLGIGKRRAETATSRSVSPVVLRLMGSLLVVALAVGTYAAIRTLWTSYTGGKFVYNNLANGCGFAAVALTVILSYLQHDVYWLGRGRTAQLDERQVQERRQVFEASYKLGTLLVFIGLATLFMYKHSLLAMAQNDLATPGDMLWPVANLTCTLFALPLLVAAFRLKQRA